MARHSVESSREPVRHVDDHEHDIHGDETHDTILHHSHTHDTPPPGHHADKPASGASVAKICAICGDNVAGRKRYKDRAGQYYCEVCFPLRGEASATDSKPDNATRPLTPKASSRPPTPAPAAAESTTVTCPDCGGKVDPSLMVEFKGVTVCASCAHDRELSAKREVARIAAAEEEARKQAERRKVLVAVIVTVVVLGGIYAVIHFLT